MARIRSLKPEIAADVKLASVSRDARYTFVLLITQSDDEGLVAGAHRQLLGTLFPHDEGVTTADLLGWIEELVTIGVVLWRATGDGAPVLEIANWSKHQRVDNKGRSQLAGILRPLSATRGELRRVADDCGLEVGVGTRSKEFGVGEGNRTEDRENPKPAVPPVALAVSRPSVVDQLLADYDFAALAPQVAAMCRLSLRPDAAAAILRMHLTGEAGYEPGTPAEIGAACAAFCANGEEFNQMLFAGYLRRAKRGVERTANRRRNAAEDRQIASEQTRRDEATAEERAADETITAHARDHPERHTELVATAARAVPASVSVSLEIRQIMVRVQLLRLIRAEKAA